MKWIDDIIIGLIQSVGSNNVYDILSYLNIYHFSVNCDNFLLQGNKAVYNRIGDFECIYISDDVVNREFILAHEVGHALIHVEEAVTFYNPLLNKGKLENEANYFATKLLYGNLEIVDGIETKEQLAKYLQVEESCIDYILNNS